MPVNFAGEVFLIRADSGMRGVQVPGGVQVAGGVGEYGPRIREYAVVDWAIGVYSMGVGTSRWSRVE